MTSKRNNKNIVAVVFSMALLIGGGAEAGGLFALGGDPAPGVTVERQLGLFEQAARWLNGAWSGLTSVFAFSEEAPPPPNAQECTPDCPDAGPGIDPLG